MQSCFISLSNCISFSHFIEGICFCVECLTFHKQKICFGSGHLHKHSIILAWRHCCLEILKIYKQHMPAVGICAALKVCVRPIGVDDSLRVSRALAEPKLGRTLIKLDTCFTHHCTNTRWNVQKPLFGSPEHWPWPHWWSACSTAGRPDAMERWLPEPRARMCLFAFLKQLLLQFPCSFCFETSISRGSDPFQKVT